MKYIFWPDFNTEELYDLKIDPLEENNLIKNESYQEKMRLLRIRFIELKANAK